MRIDLHVHLKRQQDLSELRRILHQRQLRGIAITNFHNVSFAHFIRERLPEFMIIVGQEVESTAGHILALGIQDVIHDRLAPQETIRRIHGQGGLAVLPHPYLLRNTILYHAHWPRLAFDAIETFNWRCGPWLWPNPVARAAFHFSKLPKLATTDSKEPFTIGRSCIELAAQTEAEVFSAIRRGQFTRHEETVYPSWNCAKFHFSKLFLPQRHYTCFHCRDPLNLRLYPRKRACMQCGNIERKFVACPHGHYMCSCCRTQNAFAEEEFVKFRMQRGVEV